VFGFALGAEDIPAFHMPGQQGPRSSGLQTTRSCQQAVRRFAP